jgi:hypothetical protein
MRSRPPISPPGSTELSARRANRSSVALLLALPLLAACQSASPPPKAPAWEPSNQTKANIAKSRNRPLIVEWPAAERATLESLAQHGVVAVRYGGDSLELLSRCRVKGSYTFTAVTRKDDHVGIRTEDELRASMPAYAATLSGKLAQKGRLDVDMAIIGAYEASFERGTPLEGDCQGATHLVTAVTAGAFEISAGGATEAAGGIAALGAGVSAGTSASKETLSRDGDRASCVSAPGDKAPPVGCGAFLRIEVTPVPTAERNGLQASVATGQGPQLLQPGAMFVMIGPGTRSFQVEPAPPASTTRQLSYWAFGLGSAGLLTSLSAGGTAWVVRASDVDKKCTDGVCPTSAKKSVDGYQTTAKVATISGVIGGSLIGVGTLLYYFSPERRAKPNVDVSVGPGSVMLGGAF